MHKFAVKRNSWPKTRGVAMNPVDHVSLSSCLLFSLSESNFFFFFFSSSSLTVVVTTSTLVMHRQWHVTLLAVKRPVLLLRGERVCCVVPRRRRSRGFKNVVFFSFLFLCSMYLGEQFNQSTSGLGAYQFSASSLYEAKSRKKRKKKKKEKKT